MGDLNLFRVRALDETTSTNDEVKRALEAGEREGLVVRARRQVAGYGRQGRAWTSPEGGLYCSLLLRPEVEPAALPTLSLVVGIAVRRALVSLADADAAETVQIKWPNDVVVARCAETPEPAGAFLAQNNGYVRFSKRDEKDHQGFYRFGELEALKNHAEPQFCAIEGNATTRTCSDVPAFSKLCGISCEAHAGGVCVGVGVNVVSPPERPDVGGGNAAAYAADLGAVVRSAPPDEALDRVFAAFAAAFASLYRGWERAGFAPLLDEFNAHALLTGRFVRMVDRTGRPFAQGTVLAADEQGRLVLRAEDGAEVRLASGEAHLAR